MKHVVNLTEAEEKIKNLESFRTASFTLSGGPAIIGGTHGHLPEELRADVEAAAYVVESFDTPVGWVRQDGTKVVPDVGYSLTTGQHQYLTADAWGIDFRPARGRTLRPAGGGPRRGGIDDPYGRKAHR
jgi:hypothetical protein